MQRRKGLAQHYIEVAEVLNYAKRKKIDPYDALSKHFGIPRVEAKCRYMGWTYGISRDRIKILTDKDPPEVRGKGLIDVYIDEHRTHPLELEVPEDD